MHTNKSKIIELYQTGLSSREVAAIIPTSPSSVKRVLKEAGMIRDNTAGRKLKGVSQRQATLDKYKVISKEYLIEEYQIKERTLRSIAEEHNISVCHLGKKLMFYSIPRRGGTRKGTKNKSIRIYNIGDVINGIEIVNINDINKRIYDCKCICGQTFLLQHKEVARHKSCGCLIYKTGSLHHKWKGFGRVSAAYINKLKSRSQERGLDFDLDCKFCNELLESQSGLCAISKQELSFEKGKVDASLDRIDSNNGYVKGNVQWVHKTINQMKWNIPQSEFIRLCILVANANAQQV